MGRHTIYGQAYHIWAGIPYIKGRREAWEENRNKGVHQEQEIRIGPLTMHRCKIFSQVNYCQNVLSRQVSWTVSWPSVMDSLTVSIPDTIYGQEIVYFGFAGLGDYDQCSN